MSTASRTAWTLACLALAGLMGSGLQADDVYLRSGGVFEDVVAVETGEKVRILMPGGGEVGFSTAQVLRIERADSPYLRYLAAREALQAQARDTETGDAQAGDAEKGAPAQSWLALARQALIDELRPSAREAALTAAALDPELPGLEPLMERLGLVRDAVLGDWVPERQARQRQRWAAAENGANESGADQSGVGQNEAGEDSRALRERSTQLAATEARLAAQEARLAAERAELTEQRARERAAEESSADDWRQPDWGWTGPGNGGVVFYSTPSPITIVNPGSLPPSPAAGTATVSRPPGIDIFERQPGSLIPGTLVLTPPPPPRRGPPGRGSARRGSGGRGGGSR